MVSPITSENELERARSLGGFVFVVERSRRKVTLHSVGCGQLPSALAGGGELKFSDAVEEAEEEAKKLAKRARLSYWVCGECHPPAE